jgi:hypothetical protein
MAKRYLVTLTPDERDRLTAWVSAGKRSALTITRARILLLADQGEHGPAWEDRRVAEALGCGHRSPRRTPASNSAPSIRQSERDSPRNRSRAEGDKRTERQGRGDGRAWRAL